MSLLLLQASVTPLLHIQYVSHFNMSSLLHRPCAARKAGHVHWDYSKKSASYDILSSVLCELMLNMALAPS